MRDLDSSVSKYSKALEEHSKKVGVCGIVKCIFVPGYTYKIHKETNEIRRRFNVPSQNYWQSEAVGIELVKGFSYLVTIYNSIELIQKFS